MSEESRVIVHAPIPGRICYTVSELGPLTGYSSRSWWRLIREGAVASIRIGGRVLVAHEAVVEYLRSRTDSTGSPIKPPPPHIAKMQRLAREREAAGK
jgi:hypothetical protein